MLEPFQTHEVFNQSPPFQDVNLFTTDAALKEAVTREGAAHAAQGLSAFGARSAAAPRPWSKPGSPMKIHPDC
jgi:putative acyl-CoA dehydrogenase